MKPLNDLITEFFRAHVTDVAAVFLFGSQVSGKGSGESDVDIAILFESNDKEEIRSRIEAILVKLPRRLRMDVHPVVMNYASEALLSQIFKKGRCLVVNNPQRLSEFVMIAYARIADFSHYHEKLQNGLIRRVARTSSDGRP